MAKANTSILLVLTIISVGYFQYVRGEEPYSITLTFPDSMTDTENKTESLKENITQALLDIRTAMNRSDSWTMPTFTGSQHDTERDVTGLVYSFDVPAPVLAEILQRLEQTTFGNGHESSTAVIGRHQETVFVLSPTLCDLRLALQACPENHSCRPDDGECVIIRDPTTAAPQTNPTTEDEQPIIRRSRSENLNTEEYIGLGFVGVLVLLTIVFLVVSMAKKKCVPFCRSRWCRKRNNTDYSQDAILDNFSLEPGDAYGNHQQNRQNSQGAGHSGISPDTNRSGVSDGTIYSGIAQSTTRSGISSLEGLDAVVKFRQDINRHTGAGPSRETNDTYM